MKERPILFSAPMVRALLAGTKTQTRRVCKPAEAHGLSYVTGIEDPRERGQRPLEVPGSGWFGDEEGDLQFFCPYGARGDHLWVREAFMHEPADYCWEASVSIPSRPEHTVYRADFGDGKLEGGRWTPSIHMPRRLCRIELEVTDVRVERLWAISEADARAEGWDGTVLGYAKLWESINGPGSWDANPWVWAVSFKRLRP